MSAFTSSGQGVFVGSAAGGGGGGGAVNEVENLDGTLTVSPTTGNVVASRPAITGDVSVPSGSNVAALQNSTNVKAIIAENSVQGVTAGDSSITVGGTTANPTVETGGLDLISGLHPAISFISGSGQQIKDVAPGSNGTDCVVVEQLIAGTSSFMQTLSGSQALSVGSWQTVLTTPSLAVGTWYLFGSLFANGGTTLGDVFWAAILAGTGAVSSTLPGGLYYLPTSNTADNGGSIAVAGVVVVTSQGTFTLSGATDSGGTVTARGTAMSPPAGFGNATYIGGYRLS